MKWSEVLNEAAPSMLAGAGIMLGSFFGIMGMIVFLFE